MTGFLTALGKGLAERWVTLLAIPGLLYTATLAAALTYGWTKVDLATLINRHLGALLTQTALTPAVRSAVLVAALLAGLLLATAGAGLLAQAVAIPVESACAGVWPRWTAPLARGLTALRVRRWARAGKRVQQADLLASKQAQLVAARNAIALLEPARPTWTGDRLAAAETRVWNEYGIDLPTCWPRLWLIVPETVQQAVQTGRDRFASALLTGAWVVLYLVPAALWWPAALAVVVLAVTAWRRIRTSVAALADLVEAVVDVHVTDLAAALKIDLPHNRVTPDIGNGITERIRKGT